MKNSRDRAGSEFGLGYSRGRLYRIEPLCEVQLSNLALNAKWFTRWSRNGKNDE